MPPVRRATLVGGPLDGHETAQRAAPFIWVGASDRSVRVFDAPGSGRLLYRKDGRYAYVYAGLTHMVCSGCEQPQERREEGVCRFCAQPLIPA